VAGSKGAAKERYMILFYSDRADESAIPLSDLWRDLSPQTVRKAQLWAYHGPRESPYLTDDDAERAEADTLWVMLRDCQN
jgi:hypothetical protein